MYSLKLDDALSVDLSQDISNATQLLIDNNYGLPLEIQSSHEIYQHDIVWSDYSPSQNDDNASWHIDNSIVINSTYLTSEDNLNWSIEGKIDSNNNGEDILGYNYGTDNNDDILFGGTHITVEESLNRSIEKAGDNSTNYSLNLSTTTVSSEPNDSLSNAYNIGAINNNIVIKDSIGGNDINDYFRFTLNDSGDFKLTLSDLTADADLELLDNSGNKIASSTNSESNDEIIDAELAADTYYIRVSPYNNEITDYSLSLSNTNSNSFSPTYGYGLVDASEAVAKAIGKATFDSVPDLGKFNWANDMINSPEVWAQGYTGEGVTVAVIDSGVDINHEDLSNNIWKNSQEIEGNGIDDDGNGYIDDIYGWNFIDNYNNVADIDGHGTHVAGTVAAENNNFGATGVAYNADIMAVKVLDDEGKSRDNSVTNGIYYAVNNGADVINLSLGGDYPNPEHKAALEYATEKGVVVIMAAGNDSRSIPGYPARYATEYGISVGAVNNNGAIANFSNLAGEDSNIHHVMAPGVDIYSTIPNDQYDSYDGTSMAAPHVTGVVALMLEANPNLSPEEVRQILTDTADITIS